LINTARRVAHSAQGQATICPFLKEILLSTRTAKLLFLHISRAPDFCISCIFCDIHFERILLTYYTT